MGKVNNAVVAFNAGEIGQEVMARAQMETYANAATIMENWLPESIGPMMLRPPWKFCNAIPADAETLIRRFSFDIDQTYGLLFSSNEMRVALPDGSLVTRAAVVSSVVDPDFNTGASWVNISEPGGTIAFAGGELRLSSNDTARAGVRQAVATTSINQRHTLEVVISQGPVIFSVGLTGGAGDLVVETALRKGTHYISFTPTAGTFYVDIHSASTALRTVTRCAVAPAGDLVVPTPWPVAMIRKLRFAQSADVLFVASGFGPLMRVERRAGDSWSICETVISDGPFKYINTDERITLQPSVTEGNGTLTASKPIFKSGHVSGLFAITHQGQNANADLSGQDQWSEPIRVIGVKAATITQPNAVQAPVQQKPAVSNTSGLNAVQAFMANNGASSGAPPVAAWSATGQRAASTGVSAATGSTTTSQTNQRQFTIRISGTFAGTLTLQRSIGNTSSWLDVANYTSPQVVTMSDDFDNQTVYYRIGFKAGNYTSGVAAVDLTYGYGLTTGIARVTGFVSGTSVQIEVLSPFSRTLATQDWAEGAWCSANFWPRAIAIHGGRLFAADADLWWASVAGAYESFFEGQGDADAISRAVATGDMNQIIWLMSLNRLTVGTAGAVANIRSSALDEPITNANVNVDDISTVGCADVEPAKLDTRAIFIDKSGVSAYQTIWNVDTRQYEASPLMKLHRKLGRPGLHQIAVARMPDLRVFMVRGDGQVLVLLGDSSNALVGWSRIKTDGVVESLEVLPGRIEDNVLAVIRRTINGQQKRYLEKLSSFFVENVRDHAPVDCFLKYVGVATKTITGFAHLEGRTVVVWADGAAHPDVTVTGGVITLNREATHVVAGLYYEALYKSTKLAVGGTSGTSLNQLKRPTHIGFLLSNACRGALEYGVDFKTMDVLNDRTIATRWDAGPDLFAGETDQISMPGGFDRDTRLCLRATSKGGPVTVQGLVLGVQTNDRI